MRSFIGSLLLILVIMALGGTIYYHWSTNSHLEFEIRDPDESRPTTEMYRIPTEAPSPQPATATPNN